MRIDQPAVAARLFCLNGGFAERGRLRVLNLGRRTEMNAQRPIG